MLSQICVDLANRLPSGLETRFLYNKPFPMQNLGPRDVFLQMLGWKKYILCLQEVTDVMILKLRRKLPNLSYYPTVAADSAWVRNVKILMWPSVTRLSISWYDRLFITGNAPLSSVVQFFPRKFYIRIEEKKPHILTKSGERRASGCTGIHSLPKNFQTPGLG